MRGTVIIVLLSVFNFGCGSHYYHNEAVSYVPAIKQALVRAGKCESEIRCLPIFVSGEAWVIGGKPYGGVVVSVYESRDPETTLSILESSIKVHQLHKEVPAEINVYASKHHAKDEQRIAKLYL